MIGHEENIGMLEFGAEPIALNVVKGQAVILGVVGGTAVESQSILAAPFELAVLQEAQRRRIRHVCMHDAARRLPGTVDAAVNEEGRRLDTPVPRYAVT